MIEGDDFELMVLEVEGGWELVEERRTENYFIAEDGDGGDKKNTVSLFPQGVARGREGQILCFIVKGLEGKCEIREF